MPAETVQREAEAGPPSRGAAARRLRGVALVLAFVPLGWLASAALTGEDPRKVAASAPTERFREAAVVARPGKGTSLAAHVEGDRVRVFRAPGRRSHVLRARRLEGRTLPMVMLVEGRRRGWVQVQLPTRPNGSTGWLRERDVELKQNDWHLRIDLSEHRVLTFRGTRLVSTHTVGVGKPETPTPRGRFYLTDLIEPSDPDGLYGSFAFGLSAHSDVVTRFGGGRGQIGIHGTNDTSTLQTDVSHGCIRVGNSVIESFARHFPLGTPVRIVA